MNGLVISSFTRLTARLGLLALVLFASGCATVQQARGGPGQRLDPWENWNRKVFAFNEDLDRVVLKPVATTYVDFIPQPVRRGVSNFFGNFADAWSAVNNMLQGKIDLGFQDITRVGTNTVFGLLGVLDVATEMGLDHQYEDFGQTLGHYGVGPGAYMVLPLFGPSTVRDTVALIPDRYFTAPVLLANGDYDLPLSLLQIVNTRASLLGASQVIDDISLDKYTFIRDAYLQRRRSLVFDGDVPETPEAPDATATDAAGAAAGTVAPPVSASASQPQSKAPMRAPAASGVGDPPVKN